MRLSPAVGCAVIHSVQLSLFKICLLRKILSILKTETLSHLSLSLQFPAQGPVGAYELNWQVSSRSVYSAFREIFATNVPHPRSPLPTLCLHSRDHFISIIWTSSDWKSSSSPGWNSGLCGGTWLGLLPVFHSAGHGFVMGMCLYSQIFSHLTRSPSLRAFSGP